jgi:hypothetical protein
MMCEPSIPGLATVMEVCHIQQQYWKIDPVSIMTMRSQFKSRVKGKLSLLLMLYKLPVFSNFKDAIAVTLEQTTMCRIA